jgi:serine phosphatase RsbU (regulator of sigma subunit)
MLARAQSAAAALLDDPRTTKAGPATVATLERAREWLGPDGARAHVVLRVRSGGGAHAAVFSTPGTPDSLLRMPFPSLGDGRLAGVIEGTDALYLLARRVAPVDSLRCLEVFVPLDSIYLTSVAEKTGARVALSLDRGVSASRREISFEDDTTGRGPIRVGSRPATSATGKGFFLGRSYLPLGDWSGGWREGLRGAVALELRIDGRMLTASLIDVPGWIFSNIVMVVILVVLSTLIGIIEGFAVRSGRGIVKSIEEEVTSLREAATRLGSGDLAHRIPVHGRDELSVLAGSFNEMAASLERQRTALIEKERLEEDLEVARGIQRRFLPQRSPAVPGLQIAGTSVPSREVGGDLYHYVELPGGRLGIALGDVSGKSVPAALIMSNVISALRAEAQHEVEIEKSLERINRLIVDQIEPGRFVTLFYAVADPAAGRLRYTSAGHNPTLRVSASGEIAWLNEGGVPLGVLPDTRYPSAEAPLAPGDLVVAYSDGVTEAEGPGGDGQPELFGEERLARVVIALRAEPAEAIVQGVLAEVRRFAAGRPQADDITLVVVRRI